MLVFYSHRIVEHPNYNSRSLNNDYSLLELSSAIDFSANPHIRPACLPVSAPDDGAPVRTHLHFSARV